MSLVEKGPDTFPKVPFVGSARPASTRQHLELFPRADVSFAAPFQFGGSKPMVKDVLHTIAKIARVPVPAILSYSRRKEVSRARQIYYWATTQVCPATLSLIARECGDRDHSTLGYGIARVQDFPEKFEPLLSAVCRTLAIEPPERQR